MSKKTKISRVWIEHAVDESPDTSWLGHYHSLPDERTNEFTIDREARGCRQRGEMRYFTPGSVEKFYSKASWIPATLITTAERHAYWREAMLDNAEKDFARSESFNSGQWNFIGVIAKAEVVSPQGVCQTIRSSGLWGVESDADKEYLAEIEAEQLAELAVELSSLVIGERAIKVAIRNSERGAK